MWIHIAVIASTVGCVSTILLILIWRRWYHRRNRSRNSVNSVEPSNGVIRIESSRTRIHHHMPSVHHQLDQPSNKNKGNYNNNNNNSYSLFRNGISGKRTPTLFSWIDNPSMAADAVENGWSRFAFTSYKSYMPSPSMRATLLGSCVAPVGDNNGRESSEAEISWEVSRGSDEFMQKVRLNPGLRKSNQIIQTTNSMVNSVIRTALPLPGPVLGNCVFPQESYFEITILYSSRGDEFDSIRKSVDGGDKTKLIAKGNSEALVHVTSGNSHKKINSVEEMKVDGREGGKKNESVMFSMGLTIGGPVLLKVPGSYPGSIGFNSNGSVYLDGMKLVFESEKAEWIGTDKVIGCGFDPRQKKVFFTLDSELMHVIHCQTEEFSTPLYPTLAANIDIMVLVNFGQNAFKYAPANAQRTPNPCFVSPLVNSPTIGYDDSKELFSMGRIDSQWHNRTTTKGSHNNNSTMDSDEESDADLFEIVIDRSGKS
ncbi:uncharacterized protein LOC123917319 [Trifolium pratense]|uniref:Uncharacterized protein n=1 Tax=Trifolium pratense TaxID=57577 RepID=A0ACB0J9S4_TRIPR|nr:uncharacterized protein LOC123917319 [Trifolium pratense]CAJ2640961.1 unnamed protein product [Trifolium pratense]